MKRIPFVAVLAVAVAALAFVGCTESTTGGAGSGGSAGSAGSGGTGGTTAGSRLNVVVLYTDDQGWADLGVQGAADIATPNIDQLASDGIRFTDGYAGSNVCTASRAALLTGAYPARIGVNTVYLADAQEGLHPDEVTIADMLKQEGYATLALGKWHLGDKEPVWPLAQGFDHFFGIPYSNDIFPQPARPFTLGWPPLPLYEDSVIIDDGGGDPFGVDQHPLTGMYTERAVAFIEDNSDSPFFLYVPYDQPHYPNWIGEDWMDTSGRGDYGDAVQEIDWSVGQIVQALKDNGLSENTLVIFSSDNGPWDITCEPDLFGIGGDGSCGDALPLFGWKQQTYEGGHRVPFIARWPGHIPAGIVSSELVTQMDVLPTIAEIVGIDISENPTIDGHSIKALLEDPENTESPTEHYVFWDFFAPFGGHDGGPDAVRDAEGWRLQMRDQAGNEVTELYYLPDDISEENNIAGDNPEKVQELREAAAAIIADVQANARPSWSVPPPPTDSCLNTDDLAVVCDPGWPDTVSGCFGAATSQCLQDAGASTNCAACYGAQATCIFNNCLVTCMASGFDSPECQMCIEDAGCNSALDVCTGDLETACAP